MTTELQTAPHSNGNGAMTKPTTSAAGAGLIAREAQEVQAAMYVAQQFPRDEIESERRIMEACKRKGLAEQAMYAYPRGNEKVTGPSIRLAEVLAQCWGNIDTGIVELSQRNGESEMMAFAWDLQTNYRQKKIFTVKHERHTNQGKNVKKLTDPRDIYELCANQGSRRLRACILGVIPGDIVDAAIAECEKTLIGKNTEPLGDRVKKMLAAFEAMGVTKAQIEKRLNHKADAMIEMDLVNLRKIYKSLSDGFAKAADFFDVAGEKAPGEKTDLEKEILDDAPKQEAKPESKKPAPETDPDREDALDAKAEAFSESMADCISETGANKIGKELRAAEAELGEARYAKLLAAFQELNRRVAKK